MLYTAQLVTQIAMLILDRFERIPTSEDSLALVQQQG